MIGYAEVAALREQIGLATAVLFCVPEYAGAMPGSFKNLLDWTVGGAEMYRKPVAWINVAAEGRGVTATESLATVLGYLGTDVIAEACGQILVARDALDVDGTVNDSDVRARMVDIVGAIGKHVRANGDVPLSEAR